MALDVYREIPSVLISTALGLRPRAVLISTSGIFPVYRLKPCVNLYLVIPLWSQRLLSDFKGTRLRGHSRDAFRRGGAGLPPPPFF